MKTTRSFRSLATLVVVGAVIAVEALQASPATAAEPDPGGFAVGSPPYDADAAGSVPVALSLQQEADVHGIVGAIDRGTSTFSAADAVAAGASEQAAADAAAVLEPLGWSIEGTAVEASASATSMVVALAACAGFSGYHGYYFPWGQQYGLNSCQTSQLIASVALGAAGAGAVAAILAASGYGAAAAGVVAAVLALGAAAFQACQSFSSNGAIWLNLGGQPTVSCWGQ